MSAEMDYSGYWFKHWEERSKVKDNISASGWGSKDIKEYLCDIKDVCKKLQLEKKDRLLNIGCGNGLMEILLSHWVKSITSIDLSKGMIERAKKNNREHKNVVFYKGNILNLGFLKGRFNFNKVLCNSVIQYLNSIGEIKKALTEIKNITKKNTIILISANPDKKKFNEFISGYDRLGLKKEDAEKKKKATRISLWTDPCDAKKLAEGLGYRATVKKMHPSIWQSWFMYDLLLIRR